MEAISENKILNYPDRIQNNPIPITADVFLTEYCNNRCPYCTYKRWDVKNENRYINFLSFKRYAVRLRELGVKGIILTGGGEPTLNPDFNKITQYLESEGFHYGINTNFNKLKFFKPDYLKVSLDAWDEDSYESIRGVRRFQQTRDNIQEFSRWKREQSPNTSLGIQAIGNSIEEISKFYEANRDLNVDYISIRPFESTDGVYYKTLKKGNDSPTDILSFLRKLKKCDKRIVINYKWKMLNEQEESCLANWAQIAVDTDGNVPYCCHKPYQVIGNVMDEDILEKKIKATTDMKTCDIPCRLTAPNHEVKLLKERQGRSCFI